MVGRSLDLQNRSMDRLATAQADQVAQESHLAALRSRRGGGQGEGGPALAAASAARDAAASAKAALDALAASPDAARRQALTARSTAEKERWRP